MPIYYTFAIAPGGSGNIVTITGFVNGAAVSAVTYDVGSYSDVGDVMSQIPLPINNGCAV